MKDIRLHTNSKTTATCVPNAFIDNYMADANGEFVKIYLYLLRTMSYGDNFSISGMADKFEHTEKDIFRALKYWEKMNILHMEYDSDGDLCGICLSDSAQPDDPAPTPEPTKRTAPSDTSALTPATGSQTAAKSMVTDTPARPEYTLEQLEQFQQEDGVSALMFIAEKYLGRTLNPTDSNTILYWYDTLHFSPALIEYLIESCVDKGHRSIRYMDKVALSWASSGYTTVEQARQASSIHSQTTYAILKAFGISGRTLADYELKFVERWTKEYGFSLDIISEACKRTIQAIHQPSFEYTESILSSWKKNHIQHLEDISVLDSAFQKSKTSNTGSKTVSAKNRFTSYPQRSYDMSELERKLNQSMQ